MWLLALLFSVLFLSATAPLHSHAQTTLIPVRDSDGDPVKHNTKYYFQATHLDFPDGPNSYVVHTPHDDSTHCPRIVAVDLSHANKDPITISNTPNGIFLDIPNALAFPIGDDHICGAQEALNIFASEDNQSQNGNFFIVAEGSINSLKRFFVFMVDSESELTYRMQVCSAQASCREVGWILENDKVFLVEGGNTFGFRLVKAEQSSSSHIRKHSSA